MEIREKVFPRKHRDKCRQKRFRSMCSVKKAERKIYAPICSEIRSNGDRNNKLALLASKFRRPPPAPPPPFPFSHFSAFCFHVLVFLRLPH